MIVDSSAVVAILRAEPERSVCANAIEAANVRRISAINYVEASVVFERAKNPLARWDFDDFFKTSEIIIEPVTAEQAWIARRAYRDFGKGSGHPAQLNLADVFAYALAKVTGEPLLYKGNDFVHTDIKSALDEA
jgi:ribonuclease VapC